MTTVTKITLHPRNKAPLNCVARSFLIGDTGKPEGIEQCRAIAKAKALLRIENKSLYKYYQGGNIIITKERVH